MAELTPEERDARRQKVHEDAKRAIARREKLNIRFSEDEIARIQSMAERKGLRVMPMLYEWVIATLTNEEKIASGTYLTADKSLQVSEEKPTEYSDQLLEHRLERVDGVLRQLAQVLEECGYIEHKDTPPR